MGSARMVHTQVSVTLDGRVLIAQRSELIEIVSPRECGAVLAHLIIAAQQQAAIMGLESAGELFPSPEDAVTAP
jgi:hypothetical protein